MFPVLYLPIKSLHNTSEGAETCTFTPLALPSGGNMKFIGPQEIGHLIETNVGQNKISEFLLTMFAYSWSLT